MRRRWVKSNDKFLLCRAVDGIELNRINVNLRVSRHRYRATHADEEDIDNYRISVVKNVYAANRFRSRKVNKMFTFTHWS